jgi:hemoglobin
MRHFPFTIGARERDHWLTHMATAVEQECDDPAIAGELMRYFLSTAEHMRNDTGLPITSAGYPR